MYFNFKIMSEELSIDDILLLQVIKQNSSKDSTLQSYIESKDISVLSPYVQTTKEGKTILNKLGREVYDKVTTSVEVEESDIKITDWLIKQYQSVDKLGGNKKKMAYYIACLRVQLNLEPIQLFYVLQYFISDTNRFEYSKKAENLLFTPGNPFRTKFGLDESPIARYYEEYEEIFQERFLSLKM